MQRSNGLCGVNLNSLYGMKVLMAEALVLPRPFLWGDVDLEMLGPAVTDAHGLQLSSGLYMRGPVDLQVGFPASLCWVTWCCDIGYVCIWRLDLEAYVHEQTSIHYRRTTGLAVWKLLTTTPATLVVAVPRGTLPFRTCRR